MPHSISLPDTLVDTLTAEATRAGLSLPDYAVRLLSKPRPPAAITSGADLVAYWRAEGLVGCRTDIDDSQAEARRLREQAERRGTRS